LAPSLAGRVSAAVSPYLAWVAGAWLCGAGVLSLWALGGWVAAYRLRHGRPLAAAFNGRLAVLASRMRVARPVRLLESDRVEGPVALGWRRPAILVPPGLAASLPPDTWDAVLAHELAHVRRHDYPANLLQVAAEAVLFFHPAVWWLSRRARAEREFCCDHAAVAACGGKVAYAKALAAVAQGRAPALALGLFGRSETMIVQRVRRVLQAPGGRPEAGPVALALSLGLVLSLAASLALASPAAPGPGPGETAAPARPPAAPPVAAGKEPAQKAVRQIFRPTTTGSGKTSWSELGPGPEKNDRHLMMLVHAHRGDRWPVRVRGQKEALFHAVLVDGDGDQVELRILDGTKDRRVVVKLDRPETVAVGGKAFVLSYGTTSVAGTEPEYVDDAFLIITLRPE
jgi:beta-lactamase regulating signal transducer with metallopeptidase domain